jgi:hypothetical protein
MLSRAEKGHFSQTLMLKSAISGTDHRIHTIKETLMLMAFLALKGR